VTLLSNYASSDPLAVSSERWAIAPLFQNLKTSGFKLEATRLEDDERLERLLALAFASAYRVGEWLAERTPIRLKQRGREEKRVFRLGLEHRAEVLLNLPHERGEFDRCLRALSLA